MISSNQAAEGIIAFAEAELLPALDGWRSWAAGAALALAADRAEVLLNCFAENKIVTALGVMDKDGNIDIDAAINALKKTARKRGKLTIEIPIVDISYSFTEKDIEILRGYIEKAPAGN